MFRSSSKLSRGKAGSSRAEKSIHARARVVNRLASMYAWSRFGEFAFSSNCCARTALAPENKKAMIP